MPGLTREEKLNQLTNAERVASELRKELGVSSGMGGEGGDLEATVEKRDSDARLFDSLTPQEKYDLYTNHRECWQELIAAKQEEGVRLLLGRKR